MEYPLNPNIIIDFALSASAGAVLFYGVGKLIQHRGYNFWLYTLESQIQGIRERNMDRYADSEAGLVEFEPEEIPSIEISDAQSELVEATCRKVAVYMPPLGALVGVAATWLGNVIR
jgi:hypothetical protein